MEVRPYFVAWWLIALGDGSIVTPAGLRNGGLVVTADLVDLSYVVRTRLGDRGVQAETLLGYPDLVAGAGLIDESLQSRAFLGDHGQQAGAFMENIGDVGQLGRIQGGC